MYDHRSSALVLSLVLLGSVSAFPGGVAASPATAPSVPPDGPDHGVNESEFARLWSGDGDLSNRSLDGLDDAVSSKADFLARLARSTDVPYDRPPATVDTWNRGDFGDYEPGDRHTSVHPENTSLTDGEYVADAFVRIYAIDPSTTLHEANGTRQYVSPAGTVRAIADFRVAEPPTESNGPQRAEWSIDEAAIESVTLSADGRRLDSAAGHTATLEYASLSGSPTLTVTADVRVALRRTVETCADWDRAAERCEGSWDRTVEEVDETETVTASRAVVVNGLADATGTGVRFEADGDRTGAVVDPGTAWSAVSITDGAEVRNNRQFYAAGRPDWETMVTRTASGSTRANSSVRPVQLHTYPNRAEPSVPTDAGAGPLAVEAAWGPTREGPTLPPTVDFSPPESFERVESIALTSTTLAPSTFEAVTLRGIVRGQSRTVSLPEQRTVRETALELDVVETNATHADVRGTVTEPSTGEPVTTGQITIGNHTASVNATGSVVVTVSNPSVLLRGEYEPTPWWRADRPYAAADAVAKVPTDLPDVRTLIQLVVVTILWFVPLGALVYGFDYASGGALLGLTHDS